MNKTSFIIIILLFIIILLVIDGLTIYDSFYNIHLGPKKLTFLKPDKTINFTDKIIDYEFNGVKYNMYSGNISITNYKNGYLVVLRYCNWLPNQMIKLKNNVTINKYLILDENYNVLKSGFLIIDDSSDKYLVGIEDIRVYNNNKIQDEILFIGNHFDKTKNIVEPVFGKFNFDKLDYTSASPNFEIVLGKEEKTPGYIDFTQKWILSWYYVFNDKSSHVKNINKWEKNWVFFNYKGETHIIYKWFPLHICKINGDKLDLIEIKEMPSIFAFSRGSTCGYEYDNKIWFIVHFASKTKNYYDMFVVFDLDLNLIGYSNFFKYDNSKIQFAIGLIVKKDKIVISYSLMDKYSFISEYNKKYIENLIYWI